VNVGVHDADDHRERPGRDRKLPPSELATLGVSFLVDRFSIQVDLVSPSPVRRSSTRISSKRYERRSRIASALKIGSHVNLFLYANLVRRVD
jgi:hypothetical protein